MKRPQVDPASTVLISNTMLCEASRILVNPPEFFQSPQIRLLDLMSVIECLILYENVLTLPCRVPDVQWGLPYDFSILHGPEIPHLEHPL